MLENSEQSFIPNNNAQNFYAKTVPVYGTKTDENGVNQKVITSYMVVYLPKNDLPTPEPTKTR